jgi:hypothetical protein
VAPRLIPVRLPAGRGTLALAATVGSLPLAGIVLPSFLPLQFVLDRLARALGRIFLSLNAHRLLLCLAIEPRWGGNVPFAR